MQFSAVSLSGAYKECINSINCTGQVMPYTLLAALDYTDLSEYICWKDRPSKSMFVRFTGLIYFKIVLTLYFLEKDI